MKSNLKIITAILAIISIHCGGLLVSSFWENLWKVFLGYEHLPWSRLAMVAIEIPIAIKVLNRISEESQIDKQVVFKLLLLTVIAMIGSLFREHFEPGLFLCGFAALDGTYDIMMNEHYENTFTVDIVERGMLIAGIVYYTLLKIKS